MGPPVVRKGKLQAGRRAKRADFARNSQRGARAKGVASEIAPKWDIAAIASQSRLVGRLASRFDRLSVTPFSATTKLALVWRI